MPNRTTFVLALVVLMAGLLACHDATTGPVPPASLLYSDEFYGGGEGCDPPSNPKCNPRQLTTSQRVAVEGVIDRMSGCKEMQAYARLLLDMGGMYYYIDDDGAWGDSHWPSDNQIHIWEGTFGSDMLGETLSHEIAHIYFQTNSEQLANQSQMDCGFSGR